MIVCTVGESLRIQEANAVQKKQRNPFFGEIPSSVATMFLMYFKYLLLGH